MNEDKLFELIRAQSRLISLLQTEIAFMVVGASLFGYESSKERSEEVKGLREKIETLKRGVKENG